MTTQDPETPSESPDPASANNSTHAETPASDRRGEAAAFLRDLATQLAEIPSGGSIDGIGPTDTAKLHAAAAFLDNDRYEPPAVVEEISLASVATRALASLETIAAAAEKLTTPLVTVTAPLEEYEQAWCIACETLIRVGTDVDGVQRFSAHYVPGQPDHLCGGSGTPTPSSEERTEIPFPSSGVRHRPRAVVPSGGPPTPKPTPKRDLNAEAVEHMARVSDYTLTGDGLRKAWIWFGELSRAAARDDARLFDVIRAEEERGR